MEKLIVAKITPTAKLPSRAYAGDAGLDLYADETITIAPKSYALIRTGLKMEIPLGFVGLVWDKGGLAKQGLHSLAGVVDAGYRGELFIELLNLSENEIIITAGQKMAQLLIQPVSLIEVVEGQVNASERGDKSLGSSGLN